MKRSDCPCYGCDRRKFNCHGMCQPYQDWKKAVEEENEAKRQEAERYGTISKNGQHYIWQSIRRRGK